MDNTTEQTIRATVAKFVNDGFMFTAFDVTRRVRKDIGKSTFVSHSDTNRIVQGMHANGSMNSYVKDLVQVNANVEPWLYYHPYSDVSNYDPHWIENDPNQDNMKADLSAAPTTTAATYTPPTLDLDEEDEDSVPVASTSDTTTPVSSVCLGKNQHKLTKEGRLQIPIDMARTAGFRPYQTVSVVKDGNKLTVTGGAFSAVNVQQRIVVNKDGRIRVCQSILTNISNNPKSETWQVERDNRDIVIETV